MKGLFGFSSLLLLFFSACTVKNIAHSDKEAYYHQLSAELEHSPDNSKFHILAETQFSSSNTMNTVSQEIVSIPSISKEVVKKDSKKNPTSDYIDENNFSSDKNNNYIGEEKKIREQKSLRIDKNNIFWKIGKILVTAGLVVLSIFGGIFVNVSSGGAGAFFSSGLFIGLMILALSIPFFLLAIITSYMKEKSKPIENPNEI